MMTTLIKHICNFCKDTNMINYGNKTIFIDIEWRIDYTKKYFCDNCFKKFLSMICEKVATLERDGRFYTICYTCHYYKQYCSFKRECYDCGITTYIKKRLQQIVNTNKNMKRKRFVVNRYLKNYMIIYLPVAIINIVGSYV